MLKEKAKPIKLLDNPFKKIHGHTKIELTDVKTGKKQVIEHDNTFQAGVLANYMRSLGAFNNNPYDNDSWSGQDKWRNLVGGILLFRDAIDDSNGEVPYMPSGNQMTANGAYGVTNNGTPVELGNWNSIESTVGASSIVMVYDWDTSHGNGTIGAICLTSETGGYIGYGNSSGVTASKRAIFNNQNSRAVGTSYVYNNTRYRVVEGGIYKSPLTVTEGSVFEGLETLIQHTWVRSGDVSRTFLIDATTNQIIVWSDVSGNGVSPSGTFTLDIFDCETETFRTVNCTNTSGSTFNERVYTAGNNCIIFGAKWDRYTSGAPFVAFSLTDGSYVGEIPIGTSAGNPYIFSGKLSDELEFCGARNDNILKIKTDSTDSNSWLDTNGSYTGIAYQFALCYNPDTDAMVLQDAGGSRQMQIFKNPLYLATINNLSSPVTKNNTQTMKVTYTLTEVSV